MAKHNPPTVPRPSSIRFLKNLSAISRAPTPSSALLTVLASLVGSVNPFPVACQDSSDPPPSFLCPSLQPHPGFDVQDFVLPPQTPPPSPPVPGPSRVIRTEIPTHPAKRRARRNLAPGYTQGDDGRWRKLSTWSLYGSTVCVVRGILTLSLRFVNQFFVSVRTLLARLRYTPWTISRPLPRPRQPAKPTFCPLVGQDRPNQVQSGPLSYSRYLSYSPQS